MTMKQLADAAHIVRGVAFAKEDKRHAPADGLIACLRTTNVQRSVEWDDLWFVPEQAAKRADQIVRSGDILISTANSYELVGKVAMVGAMPYRATLGAFISLIRPKPHVNASYLYHQLTTLDVQSAIRSCASTTTNISNVSTKKLATIRITLPDRAAQLATVSYLDEQLSRLDASVAALHRVQANLKRYRASVLKSACEGRLVPTEAELARREGRNFETGTQLLQRILADRRVGVDGRSKYKEPSAPAAVHRSDSPEGWAQSNVDQLAEVGTGATPKRDVRAFYEGGQIAWVTSGAVNGEYVDRASEFVTERALAETNLSIYPPGTLLLAMYGEGKTRGRCSELRIAATTNQALAAIQAAEPVRRYLRLLLECSYEETRKAASGGVQPNLNLSLVRAIRVPLPPLAEQHRIGAEADRRLSLIRVAEAQVAANVARAKRLRQSILQAAFAHPGSAGQ